MSLSLDVELIKSSLSVMESARCNVRLTNSGNAPLEIPFLDDTSGALTAEFYDRDKKLVRKVSPFSKQVMLNGGRPDFRCTTAQLGPGESWCLEQNLAEWHYPLNNGEYSCKFTYEYPPLSLGTESKELSVNVGSAAACAVSHIRDNPIIDGVTEVVRITGKEKDTVFLKLFTAGRPLVSWYSESFDIDKETENVFCANAVYYQDESFGPFFRKWIVSVRQGKIRADLFRRGLREGKSRSGIIPEGAMVFPFAINTQEDDVLVFFGLDGILNCCKLGENGLENRFRYGSALFSKGPVVLSADGNSVYITGTKHGIEIEVIDISGKLIDKRKMFATRLSCRSCMIDAVDGVIKAVFTDNHRIIQTAAAGFDGHVNSSIFELPPRGSVRESSFGADEYGKVHLLIAMSNRKLFYFSGTHGPLLMGKSDERFFPDVVAGADVFLGYFTSEHGYRYYLVDPDPYSKRIVNFDTELPVSSKR